MSMPALEAQTPTRPCPGEFTRWSAFGAGYPDTTCSTVVTWGEGDEPGTPVLCDADDDYSPAGPPCPFCAPRSFDEWYDAEGSAAMVQDIELGITRTLVGHN